MRIASNRLRGVTLLELLIVITIIAIMLSLLLPAVQYSRKLSRRLQCESNLHQLGIALSSYIDVTRGFPVEPEADRIGGWSLAILPFIENTNLAEELSGNPLLSSAAHRNAARYRPEILTCPSAYDGDSRVPPIAVGHYALLSALKPRVAITPWMIQDVPLDTTVPWAISPELGDYDWSREANNRGPHSDGYNSISGTGRNAQSVIFSGGF